MSLPALDRDTDGSEGLRRSAALMRALGERASAVWASLSPQEAQRLTAAMDVMPDSVASETAAARTYVQDMANTPRAIVVSGPGFWSALSNNHGAALGAMISNESPQIIAVILSRLNPEAAATTVRALPQALASEALHRLLHLGDIHPAALAAIETALGSAFATSAASADTGHERVARIFDSLDSRIEQGLMAALDSAEPGVGDRIRALMFTFDDMATLGPASLQTILASTDRAVLILALKGAKPETAEAFFANMTSRAKDLLRSEIEAAGPVRRSEIESARAEVIAMARTLVNRGDILSGDDEDDDELIE